MGRKILVVDDEKNIRELISYNLSQEGYEILTAADGREAEEMVEGKDVDLIILDLMLPEIDGFTLCRRLKSSDKFRQIPIIMLTARDEETDKVVGLELGADDYITKPFGTRELVARVRAVLRRVYEKGAATADDLNRNGVIVSGPLSLDSESYQVEYEDRRIDLTPKEFELLKLLMSNPNKVMTRDMLLNRIWGYDYFGDTRTVDVHIRRLRSKIPADFITTVRGVGYKFEELE